MQTIEQEILQLESQLTGALLFDLDIREQIYYLKKKQSPVGLEPIICTLGEECVGCGS